MKLKTSSVFIVALLLSAIGLSGPTSAQAQSGYHQDAHVCTHDHGLSGKLNVRRAPGTNAQIVDALRKGQYIDIIRNAGYEDGYRWVKIYVPESGVYGYVAATYLC